jgi:hypothetical protein
MERTLKKLLQELRNNPRNIDDEEVTFICDELKKAMASGGYESEVNIKFKFFFDEKGNPFLNVTTLPGLSNSSVYVGDFLVLDHEYNGHSVEYDVDYASPSKHTNLQALPLSDSQEITLFNILINLPVLCMQSIYDQAKFEFYTTEFWSTEKKEIKNQSLKKIRDYAERIVFRSTSRRTKFVGRKQGTKKQRRLTAMEIENRNSRMAKIEAAIRNAKNVENKSEIARGIGISTNTLNQWLKNMGIKGKRGYFELVRAVEDTIENAK